MGEQLGYIRESKLKVKVEKWWERRSRKREFKKASKSSKSNTS